MNASAIFEKLNSMAPLSMAMDFDNAGFLLGNMESEVKKAVICLDVTSSVVDYAIEQGANLIISHHPIIFSPLKNITSDNNRVFACLSNGISVISMHTNLDSADDGVNDTLAKALGLVSIEKITDEQGFVFRKGNFKEPMSAEGLARFTKSKLGGVVRYVDSGKAISTVAVLGGSGGDYWRLAKESGADALITADVKHSLFIDALENGFTLLDAGHFHTENVVVNSLFIKLQSQLTEVEFLPYNSKEFKAV